MVFITVLNMVLIHCRERSYSVQHFTTYRGFLIITHLVLLIILVLKRLIVNHLIAIRLILIPDFWLSHHPAASFIVDWIPVCIIIFAGLMPFKEENRVMTD